VEGVDTFTVRTEEGETSYPIAAGLVVVFPSGSLHWVTSTDAARSLRTFVTEDATGAAVGGRDRRAPAAATVLAVPSETRQSALFGCVASAQCETAQALLITSLVLLVLGGVCSFVIWAMEEDDKQGSTLPYAFSAFVFAAVAVLMGIHAGQYDECTKVEYEAGFYLSAIASGAGAVAAILSALLLVRKD
jgi:hypothetical protein